MKNKIEKALAISRTVMQYIARILNGRDVIKILGVQLHNSASKTSNLNHCNLFFVENALCAAVAIVWHRVSIAVIAWNMTTTQSQFRCAHNTLIGTHEQYEFREKTEHNACDARRFLSSYWKVCKMITHTHTPREMMRSRTGTIYCLN